MTSPWRISQTVPVRVYFAVYRNITQETSLSLVAKKLDAALINRLLISVVNRDRLETQSPVIAMQVQIYDVLHV